MKRKPQLREVESLVVSTSEFRRAVSALSSSANVAAEALRVGGRGERDRARAVIDNCTNWLAALAFSLIPKVEP